MNAYRERSFSRVQTRQRRQPLWLTILLIVGGALVMGGLGFGLSTLLHREPSAESASGSPSTAPLPCKTTLVSPAEVLPQTDKVRINVWNSTQRVGLATDTAKVLSARGFTIVGVDNDPLNQQVSGVAEIRYGPKGAAAAQLISFYIPGAVMVGDNRTGRVVDVALGQEFKKLNGEAEIAAAMASPSPSLSGAGCLTPSPGAPAPEPTVTSAPSPSMSP